MHANALAAAAAGGALVTGGLVAFVPFVFAGGMAAYDVPGGLERHLFFAASLSPPTAVLYGGYRLAAHGVSLGASPLVPVAAVCGAWWGIVAWIRRS